VPLSLGQFLSCRGNRARSHAPGCVLAERAGHVRLRCLALRRLLLAEDSGNGGMSKHVAVLMGGWSAEREISLKSGRACADAAERAGYRVTRVDVGRDIANVL